MLKRDIRAFFTALLIIFCGLSINNIFALTHQEAGLKTGSKPFAFTSSLYGLLNTDATLDWSRDVTVKRATDNSFLISIEYADSIFNYMFTKYPKTLTVVKEIDGSAETVEMPFYTCITGVGVQPKGDTTPFLLTKVESGVILQPLMEINDGSGFTFKSSTYRTKEPNIDGFGATYDLESFVQVTKLDIKRRKILLNQNIKLRKTRELKAEQQKKAWETTVAQAKNILDKLNNEYEKNKTGFKIPTTGSGDPLEKITVTSKDGSVTVKFPQRFWDEKRKTSRDIDREISYEFKNGTYSKTEDKLFKHLKQVAPDVPYRLLEALLVIKGYRPLNPNFHTPEPDPISSPALTNPDPSPRPTSQASAAPSSPPKTPLSRPGALPVSSTHTQPPLPPQTESSLRKLLGKINPVYAFLSTAALTIVLGYYWNKLLSEYHDLEAEIKILKTELEPKYIIPRQEIFDRAITEVPSGNNFERIALLRKIRDLYIDLDRVSGKINFIAPAAVAAGIATTGFGISAARAA